MSKRLTVREEAKRRGVSHGKIYYERKAQNRVNQVGEDFDFVYAWRWTNDNTSAKIGVAKISTFETRTVTTYHPTDDMVLIGIMKCRSREEAEDNERYFLNEVLERTRFDREWVIIDEEFNRIIDEAFISDPNVLSQMFDINIETEKSYNENS